MNSTDKTLRLAAISFLAAFAVAAAPACSGDDNNGNPTPTGDGSTADVTTSGDDSSTPTGDTSTTNPGDSAVAVDAPNLDTGSCKSTMTSCNTCYTAQQAAADPYNGCSSFATSCVPFDPSQVPSHPML